MMNKRFELLVFSLICFVSSPDVTKAAESLDGVIKKAGHVLELDSRQGGNLTVKSAVAGAEAGMGARSKSVKERLKPLPTRVLRRSDHGIEQVLQTSPLSVTAR